MKCRMQNAECRVKVDHKTINLPPGGRFNYSKDFRVAEIVTILCLLLWEKGDRVNGG